MNREVKIIDYGMGNLFSVRRAFEASGARVEMAESPREVSSAELLVLPGVGAFRDGMCGLKQRDLVKAIQEYSAKGRPMLGICLGMQMLLDSSEEFGAYEGLGLIPGRVVAIPSRGIDGQPLKIPHIGWNELEIPTDAPRAWENSIFEDISAGQSMYFVHSFNAQPTHSANRVADCYYGGVRIAAAVRAGAIYGCQFHPEKSGHGGLRIIRNFLLM
jgi:glutamine amidotransferase